MSERERFEKYLISSIESSLNLIQDNIFFITKEFSNRSRSLNNQEMLSDSELIDFFSINENLIPGFPPIIERITIEERTNNSKKIDEISLNNFIGVMSFPIEFNENREVTRIIKMDFNILKVVKEYLPTIIDDVVSKKYNIKGEILFDIASGENILKRLSYMNADIIIDLNKYFNISKINDYYIDRFKRNPIMSKNDYLINNHLYLEVNSFFDHLKKYYNLKFKYYVVGLIIVYILLLTSIIILFYTTYKIHLNTLREKDFTSLISHELKTPLSVIQLGSENLSSGLITQKSEVIFYGNMINKESLYLKTMIDKILTISTDSSGTFNHMESISLESILLDIKQQLFAVLEQTGTDIEVKNPNKKIILYCNKPMVTSAIFNVIQNSIKYGANFSMDRKVFIDIKEQIKKRKLGVLIKITDYGKGISWKDSKNIFKPFYRGKNITDLQLSGSGLGLAFAQRIIKQHKGTIEFIKNLRKETVFEIWLPIRIENEKNIID